MEVTAVVIAGEAAPVAVVEAIELLIVAATAPEAEKSRGLAKSFGIWDALRVCLHMQVYQGRQGEETHLARRPLFRGAREMNSSESRSKATTDASKAGHDAALETTRASFYRRWRLRVGIFAACCTLLALAAFAARRTLLLDLARIALNRDPALIAQEKADGVMITFANRPAVWIAPMKNEMDEIWAPIHANGVNYYTFAGPRNWMSTYSERSNPSSPYYQAWVGGYVIQLKDGTVPDDLQTLGWQVTALDQRSWLEAMGDAKPLAESSMATRAGNIAIDGHELPLWHGIMKSHSDLSADPKSPLSTLIGMPPNSTWPRGIVSFHDVTLEGYMACWFEPRRRVSIVVYAVAASYPGQTRNEENGGVIDGELLEMMRSAKLEGVS